MSTNTSRKRKACTDNSIGARTVRGTSMKGDVAAVLVVLNRLRPGILELRFSLIYLPFHHSSLLQFLVADWLHSAPQGKIKAIAMLKRKDAHSLITHGEYLICIMFINYAINVGCIASTNFKTITTHHNQTITIGQLAAQTLILYIDMVLVHVKQMWGMDDPLFLTYEGEEMDVSAVGRLYCRFMMKC